MSKATIVGAYNTKFGSFVDKNKATGEITDTYSLYQLMAEAAQGAVKDSGLDPSRIDGVWIGSFAPGVFTNQDHLGPLALEAFPAALRFKPTQRVEGACASSSLAIYNAIYALESGRFRNVLVVGVEKMNLLKTAGVTHALAGASYWPTEGGLGITFPGLFAEYAKGYALKYGLSQKQLAELLAAAAALCYRNGLENPLAHFGKGGPSDKLGLSVAAAILGLPDEKNPVVADPLRLHDCSLVTDGAAALVLSTVEEARRGAGPAVEIAGIGHTTERMAIKDRANMHEFTAGKEAARAAYREAGIAAKD
ncbi:MAG TPA: hypothetical protein VLH39_06145, partial [Magnetospirillaceae bacterium]|nr:hypothetical protein [Magnetospirillaceae bacterium]